MYSSLRLPVLDPSKHSGIFAELSDTEETPTGRRGRHSQQPSTNQKPRTERRHLSGDSDLFDSDIEDEGTPKACKRSTESVYGSACSMYGAPQCTVFLDQLDRQETSVDLRHQNLSTNELKTIAVALVKDEHITGLNLSRNNIEPRGLRYLGDLMSSNSTIRSLDLSHNPLGREGAECMSGMLTQNKSLTSLVLSGCDFVERDAFYITDALQNNTTLLHLDLSHNEFMEDGGILLGRVLASSDLRSLNLSWNHLRCRGAKALAYGLEGNDTLTHLNVAWNGFSDEGTEAICDALRQNDRLTSLDLSDNRLCPTGACHLAKLLETNTTLTTLKASRNPITSEGASIIVLAIETNKESAVDELILEDVPVTPDILALVRSITERRPFSFTHGRFVRSPDPLGQKLVSGVRERVDPFGVLMAYVENEGLRIWDIFTQMDKNGDMVLTRQEVAMGLQTLGVPLFVSKLDELIERMDENGDGFIDFGELFSQSKQFKLHRQMATFKRKREEALKSKFKAETRSTIERIPTNDLRPTSPRPMSQQERSRSPSLASSTPKLSRQKSRSPDGRSSTPKLLASRSRSPKRSLLVTRSPEDSNLKPLVSHNEESVGLPSIDKLSIQKTPSECPSVDISIVVDNYE